MSDSRNQSVARPTAREDGSVNIIRASERPG
jgi:hypothetical protein